MLLLVRARERREIRCMVIARGALMEWLDGQILIMSGDPMITNTLSIWSFMRIPFCKSKTAIYTCMNKYIHAICFTHIQLVQFEPD